MNKSRRGLFILIVIGLSVGSLLAFRFYQSRVQKVRAMNSSGQQWQGGEAGANRGSPDGGNRPPQGFNQGPGVGGGGQPQPVEVATVQRGSIREQLSLVGSLKPKEQVDIASKMTGKLERILVDVGDVVKQGQLIAELETDEVDQQVLRAEASLAVTEATFAQRQTELENARAEEARAAELSSEGLMSAQALQTAQTRAKVVQSQLALSQAQIRQAQADLAELRIRRQQTEIRAPFDGWVGRRNVHPGALVSPNTPLVTLMRLSTMVTQVSVPEREFTKLRPGNRAVVLIDALGGRAYEGRVARLSPWLDPATRSGTAEVEIPNPDGQMKAEMFARIQLDLGTERQALLVPRDAVLVRGDQTGVNVLVSDRVRFRPIQTGLSSDRGVEVLGGLEEGTTIVTRGSQNLKDGDAVIVKDKQATAGQKGGRS